MGPHLRRWRHGDRPQRRPDLRRWRSKPRFARVSLVTTAELLDQIREQAMKLPEQLRLQLAHELQASVDDDEVITLHPAWREEIERRVAVIRAGKSTGKPAAEAMADIRAKLQRR